jgi:hypothetical protein
MPRQRKSAASAAISGAYAKDPKRARKDLVAAGAIGPYRPGSVDPATVWDELVAVCPSLTAADRTAVECAVDLIVQKRSDPVMFQPSKVTCLINLLGKLGCTPASRLSMALPEVKDPHDKAEAYFR